MIRFIIVLISLPAIYSCHNKNKTAKDTSIYQSHVFAKEPNDSARYKLVKYDFYFNENGRLCERKLAMARDSSCKCDFTVYYDSVFTIFGGAMNIEKPLDSIVDIQSFELVDDTEYSKDKKHVFYFYANSGGGNRFIVKEADPKTFKRLCEYRWGVDKNFVFYRGNALKGLDPKKVQPLYSPDTSNHFVSYVKDDKIVYCEYFPVEGAEAKTFKVTGPAESFAEDKNYKYESGSRKGRNQEVKK
jgi:hypothetical protein